MPRLLLAILFIVLATLPAQAHAHSTGPTELESIWIADRWAAKEAPGHTNHCANGRRVVTRSTAAIKVEEARSGVQMAGFADGWVWTGTEYTWDYTRCTWTTLENMDPANQCAVDAHELMHYVIGPEHVGPLDPRHPGPVECFTHSEPVPTTTVRKNKRVRRTQAQINRSIRYRKAQARARARAAMKRLHAR